MSNHNSNNSNDKTATENKAVIGVEVVKDDTVVYEDGDFKDYNAENDIQTDKKTDSNESDTKDHSEKVDKSAKKEDNSKNDADNKSAEKEDKASDDKAGEDKDSESDKPEQEEKTGITMAGIYQWASKLKDEFTSEAADLTHEVTEKAAAMTLGKLLDAVEFELTAFDKSIEAAKKLIENAEDERKKIESKKEKYQGMIDKLDQE